MADSGRELEKAAKNVRTPEGDNEGLPDAPLTPETAGVDGLEKPPAIDTNKL